MCRPPQPFVKPNVLSGSGSMAPKLPQDIHKTHSNVMHLSSLCSLLNVVYFITCQGRKGFVNACNHGKCCQNAS